MDINKELSGNKAILLIIPSGDYNTQTLDIVKKLPGTVCYVTLNKTFDALMETFKKNRIKTDRMVFIDGITKTIRNVPDQADKCYFISSPGSLTELSIAINKLLRHNFEYVVFDSLTSLLVYESKAPVARFVSSLVNAARNSKSKIILYALSVNEQNELIKESGMFVDKVVEIK